MSIFRKIGKGIKQGFKVVGGGARKALGSIAKETGKLDRGFQRATGIKLSDAVREFVPGGGQALDAFQDAKKLSSALEGKRSFKSVIRESDLLPDITKQTALAGYQEAVNEGKRLGNVKLPSQKLVQDRFIKPYYKQYAETKDLPRIRKAVEDDVMGNINDRLREIKLRNPILSNNCKL